MIDLDELRQISGDGYWYLATPYSKYPDGPEIAFRHASIAAAWLISQKVPVFCPITHSHPIAIHGSIDQLNHEIWLTADKPLMVHSVGAIVCMMDGWSESTGIKFEMDYFLDADKPIRFLPWPIHL